MPFLQHSERYIFTGGVGAYLYTAWHMAFYDSLLTHGSHMAALCLVPVPCLTIPCPFPATCTRLPFTSPFFPFHMPLLFN